MAQPDPPISLELVRQRKFDERLRRLEEHYEDILSRVVALEDRVATVKGDYATLFEGQVRQERKLDTFRIELDQVRRRLEIADDHS